MKIYKYQIKIRGIKDHLILDEGRGKLFKDRFDSMKPEEKGNLCRIGDQWSGTWHDISHVFRIEEYVPDKKLPEQSTESRGKQMTFNEFAEKHPEKAALFTNFKK